MLKDLRALAAISAAFTLSLHQPARAQGVAINTTGAPEVAFSILDITSTTRGVLIPRMTYAQRIQMSTNVPPYAPGVLGAGDNGMWVFQTDDAPSSLHGYYYWNGTVWVQMSYGPAWSRAGNAGTTVANNFLGTIGQVTPAGTGPDVVIGTGAVERMRVLVSNGYVGIGTAAPAEILEVNGGMRVFTTVVPGNVGGNIAGVIRYQPTSPAGTTNNYHEGYQVAPAAPANVWARLENAEKRVINAPYDSTVYTACGGGVTWLQDGVTPNDFGGAGAPFGDPTESPFPTGATSAATEQAARIQYLFQSTELLANPPNGFGLCAGTITEFAIKMVDGDLQGPPAAALDLYIRLAFVPPATASLVAYNPAASTNGFFHYYYQGYIAGSGWRTFPLGTGTPGSVTGTPGGGQTQLAAPFYNGSDDIIVEISYRRAFALGYSPRAEMQYTLGYTATRYGYGAVPPAPANGYSITDASPITLGLTANRPLCRFLGQVKQPSFVMGRNDYLLYDGAILIGRPTWATGLSAVQKGPGVVAAQYGVYDNLVRLSDHVFDRYFDGRVQPQDAEAAAGYTRVELEKLKDYLATERHLPNMPSREEWNTQGAPSLGQMGTHLWRTVEDQALYIIELERGLAELEGAVLGAGDAAATEARIKASTLLTAGEKERLIGLLRSRTAQGQR